MFTRWYVRAFYFSVAVLSMLAGLLIGTAISQTSTATLTGTVHDRTGAVLAGVGVNITNTDRNSTVTTLSNDTGYYVIPALIPGNYTITAELAGFKKFVRDGIQNRFLTFSGTVDTYKHWIPRCEPRCRQPASIFCVRPNRLPSHCRRLTARTHNPLTYSEHDRHQPQQQRHHFSEMPVTRQLKTHS